MTRDASTLLGNKEGGKVERDGEGRMEQSPAWKCGTYGTLLLWVIPRYFKRLWFDEGSGAIYNYATMDDMPKILPEPIPQGIKVSRSLLHDWTMLQRSLQPCFF